jgi:hypothetical protein
MTRHRKDASSPVPAVPDGIVLRPEAALLAGSALIPPDNLIRPAPNQFTHVVIRPQPYRFVGAPQGAPAAGELAPLTLVVLLVHDGGPRCRVADGQGLYVEIDYDSLRKL